MYRIIRNSRDASLDLFLKHMDAYNLYKAGYLRYNVTNHCYETRSRYTTQEQLNEWARKVEG